jgi:6-pyruvoyltetrahydropterin/6-carboxytetrahydropterin synthase
MYTAETEIRFRARHALRLSGGTVEPMHEHDWRVRATVQSDRLDADGMVIDFYRLKKLLREAVRPLSECESINTLAVFQKPPANPSTEQIARYIFDHLACRFPAEATLTEITVWETADCRGSYTIK